MMNMYALPFVLCTWFGLGKLKPAPGTWGSAGALPFAWLLQMYGGPWAVAVAASLLGLAGSWALDLPTGATIVSAFGLVLVLVAAGRRLRGAAAA